MSLLDTALKTTGLALALCFCQSAGADTGSRIAEILTRDSFSPDGEILTSKTFASVEGCFVRLPLIKPGACSRGQSFGKTEKLIDVRVLATKKEFVDVRDLTGTRSESLGASVAYSYRWLYGQNLASANSIERRILDEEYARYPNDVASRLGTLSERFRVEIDPDLYSQSIETTSYCSGVEITSPLPNRTFRFYVKPEHAGELVDLIERYALQCEHGSTS
mgnify:CR=1 FL=1